MAANVETMMYVREKPWHGLGTMVMEAPNSTDALRIAELDWNVISNPVFTEDGFRIPNYKANIRDKDNKVLGIVTDRYKIVQNVDAFAFTDNVIGGDVRYETAGSLQEGKKIWMLAKMPECTVVGDKVEPYLCFTNSHDGSGAIRVCMTPIRVVCNNTLNLALNKAKRQWSTKHVGNIEEKMQEARIALEMAGEYMYELDKCAEKMANISVTDERIQEILDELFPIKENDSARKQENVKKMKDEYMVCYFMPDIAKFKGTAWGAVNAMTDMVAHTAPRRETFKYRENNWGRIMDGHVLVDSMFTKLMAQKAI